MTIAEIMAEFDMRDDAQRRASGKPSRAAMDQIREWAEELRADGPRH